MNRVEILKCTDCGVSFPFTVSEQLFFETQGWKKPIRCRDCRAMKKSRQLSEDRYAGLYETMRNRHCMKRDVKGRVLNRSGTSWIYVDPEYLLPLEL